MNETQAREAICRVGKSLFDRGYVHATAGNISVRLDDGGLLITPTDACLGFLEPDALAQLDADGRQASGLPASKTVALYTAIYRADAECGGGAKCIIHTHSTHCVALTLQQQADELLPPITPYFVMKVGHVPVIPYFRPGDPAAALAVADAIRSWAGRGLPLRAVMLPRLGPTVWHQGPGAAMATLEELEETARLWAQCNPRPQPLSGAQIEELRAAFGARW